MKYYKCPVCNDVACKVVDDGHQLFCCEKPMKELIPNTIEASKEKHIPVAEYIDGKLTVFVGEVLHPMLLEHHIAYINVEINDQILHQKLAIDAEPVATFYLGNYHGKITLYEYCNIHGLWKNELYI